MKASPPNPVSTTSAPDVPGSKRGRWFWLLAAGAIGVLVVLVVKVAQGRGVPFVHSRPIWAIGIYEGDSPFRMAPAAKARNPVLTAADVTDTRARFVADPFMVRHEGLWYMFLEILRESDATTDISVATSEDGYQWSYRQVVLDEPFNLSYPYVFRWGDRWYMVPESAQASSVRLYEATEFPYRWSLVTTLVELERAVDPSLVFHEGRWWLFVEASPRGSNHTLRLYHAEALTGPWSEHPRSPIVRGDANIARPGGRILVHGGRLHRIAQDCDPEYGTEVRVLEVTELSPSTYAEREIPGSPVLRPSGSGWNGVGMHTLDPHEVAPGRWLAVVDGKKTALVFGLRY